MPQHHQNDGETPHHQPGQENRHPPHQHDATTMVTMHDVITVCGGFLLSTQVSPTETLPPIFLSTQNPGAMSQSAMWQPDDKQQLMSLFVIIGQTQLNNNNST